MRKHLAPRGPLRYTAGKMKKIPPKNISLSRNAMIKVMSPLDANHYGYVHGGAIMRYVDEAAFISATRHAGRNTVTAAIDHLSFENPVHIGDLLVLKSQVNFTGRSSMEVGVKIESENPATGRTVAIGSAYVTMVALDAMGKPTAVPPLLLETKLDKQRAKRAKQRCKFRKKLRNR